MRTCFIHIGTHKTGSTTIQKALADNRDQMLRCGYTYPVAGRGLSSTAHHKLAFAIRNASEDVFDLDLTQTLIQEIQTSQDHVILSSEEFVNSLYFTADRMKRFVESLRAHFVEVKAIVYYRSQEGYILSNYFEHLKHGYAQSFETYVIEHLTNRRDDEIAIDYISTQALAEDVFEGNVTVRPYDRLRNQGLVTDFWRQIGLGAKLPDLEARLNVRQPLSELMKAYFQTTQGRAATDHESETIAQIASFISQPNDLAPSYSVSCLIRNAFSATNKDLNSRYGLDLPTEAALPEPSRAASIDHLFNPTLSNMVRWSSRYADRLGATDTALTEAQRLAVERFETIKAQEQRIDDTDSAFRELEQLALDRYAAIVDLEERLQAASKPATP